MSTCKFRLTASTLGLTTLLLTACANPQQMTADASQKCPQARIDVQAPDFSQKLPPDAVQAFYGCMMTELRPSGEIPVIGKQGSVVGSLTSALGASERAKAPLYQNLAYQQALWQAVAAGEKTPAAAQEAWVLFSVGSAYQHTSVNAMEQAASAARAAERSSNKAAVTANDISGRQNMGVTCMRMGADMAHCQ